LTTLPGAVVNRGKGHVTAPIGASCSSRFEFEPLTDELHGFGHRGGAETEGALDEVRHTANVPGSLEDRRLVFAE